MSPLEALTARQLPGLSLPETRIAREYLTAHAGEFETVEFQVRLGQQVDIGPQYGEEYRRMAALSSQRRADLVALAADVVTIVEVKERISLSALGQLLGYRTLWQAEHPDGRRVVLVVIGSGLSPDAPEVLTAYGVHVEVFP